MCVFTERQMRVISKWKQAGRQAGPVEGPLAAVMCLSLVHTSTDCATAANPLQQRRRTFVAVIVIVAGEIWVIISLTYLSLLSSPPAERWMRWSRVGRAMVCG